MLAMTGESMRKVKSNNPMDQVGHLPFSSSLLPYIVCHRCHNHGASGNVGQFPPNPTHYWWHPMHMQYRILTTVIRGDALEKNWLDNTSFLSYGLGLDFGG